MIENAPANKGKVKLLIVQSKFMDRLRAGRLLNMNMEDVLAALIDPHLPGVFPILVVVVQSFGHYITAGKKLLLYLDPHVLMDSRGNVFIPPPTPTVPTGIPLTITTSAMLAGASFNIEKAVLPFRTITAAGTITDSCEVGDQFLIWTSVIPAVYDAEIKVSGVTIVTTTGLSALSFGGGVTVPDDATSVEIILSSRVLYTAYFQVNGAPSTDGVVLGVGIGNAANVFPSSAGVVGSLSGTFDHILTPDTVTNLRVDLYRAGMGGQTTVQSSFNIPAGFTVDSATLILGGHSSHIGWRVIGHFTSGDHLIFNFTTI